MATSLQFNSHGAPIRMYAEETAVPPEPSAEKRPAILLLHGSGGHIDFWTDRLAPLLQEARVGLYAPHYFERTGTIRADLATITDGVHVPKWLETVDDALAFTAGRPGVDPRRIVLAGISLGAFLATSFAAQLSASSDPEAQSRIRALLEISGGLPPPYDALATARMPPTLILHGAIDNIVPVSFARDLDRKLTELGVEHRTEIIEREGHWFGSGSLVRILLAVSSFLEPYLG